MTHEQLTHDYRSSMQRAAFAYLKRHEAQYLADSDLLFDNCVRHMTTALEVPIFMAQKLVHSAWTELQLTTQTRWLGIDYGQGPSWTILHLSDSHVDRYHLVQLLSSPQRLHGQFETTHKQPPQ